MATQFFNDNTVFLKPINTYGTNTFQTSTNDPTLRINQTGEGHAFVVEDSTHPDADPFIIDASGNVNIIGYDTRLRLTTPLSAAHNRVSLEFQTNNGSTRLWTLVQNRNANTGPVTTNLDLVRLLDITQPSVLTFTQSGNHIANDNWLFTGNVTVSSNNLSNQNLTVVGNISAVGAHVFTSNTDEPTLRVTQTGNGPVLLVEDSENPDITPLFIPNNGGLLTGTRSVSSFIQNTFGDGNSVTVSAPRIQNHGAGQDSGNVIFRYRDNTNLPAIFALIKGRPTTESLSVSAVQVGDRLGKISFVGHDNENFTESSTIDAIVTNVPSLSSVKSDIRFLTTHNTLSTMSEKMRIASSGNVGIGTSQPNETLTVVGNISADGDVSASNLKITDWNSAHTTVQSNSANWQSTYSTTNTLSGLWSSDYIFKQLGLDIDGEAAGDYSGYSVSTNAAGDIVAIGATNNDGGGSNSGQVRVYKYISGSWIQQGQDINGEAANDESGYSVSINAAGDIVAIGAPNNSSFKGHVRVYKFISGSWIKQGQDIDGEASINFSGRSVSINAAGDIVAVGAPFNNGDGSAKGHVKIYKNISNVWTQEGSDINGEADNDQSGRSVSINAIGDIVAIGASGNDVNGSNSGHVRIYKNISNVWTQQGSDIDGEISEDFSGYSVSINAAGDIVAVGAIYSDSNGTNSGHVKIYKYISGSWIQQGQDIDGEAVNDNSGYSVSINAAGDIVAVGAPYNDSNGTDSGHVKIYKYISGSWIQQGQDIDGETADDQSGRFVSINAAGDIVAVGAPYNSSFKGHVRVYTNDLGYIAESYKASNLNPTLSGLLTVVGNISATGFLSVSDGNSNQWNSSYSTVQSNSATNWVAENFIVACSDENTNLVTEFPKLTFRMPYAMELQSIRASVNTAPVGSTIIVDVNQNSSSIFSTKLSIDDGEKTSLTAATSAVLSTTTLSDDAEITIDIDQVGSTTAGKGLKLVFKGYRL